MDEPLAIGTGMLTKSLPSLNFSVDLRQEKPDPKLMRLDDACTLHNPAPDAPSPYPRPYKHTALGRVPRASLMILEISCSPDFFLI